MHIDIDVVAPLALQNTLTGTGNAGDSLGVADLSLTSGKLAPSAVIEDKIATAAVTENKIGSGAVTNTKLGDLSVSTAKLQDGSVTTVKLADDAITLAKIDQNGAADGDILSWDNTASEWVVGQPSSSGGARAFVSSATFTGIVTGTAPTVTLNSPGITIALAADTWPHSLRIPYVNGTQTDGGGELDITITQAGSTREQMECFLPEARVHNDQTSGSGIQDTASVDIIQSVGAGTITFRMTDAATLQPNPILNLQFP